MSKETPQPNKVVEPAAKPKVEPKVEVKKEIKEEPKTLEVDHSAEDEEAIKELAFVSPILALNLRVQDRIQLIEEFKLGIPIYKPSDAVISYLERKPAQEIATHLPLL